MCQRQSITTECIFGEEEEDSVLDDSPSPLVPQIVPPLVPVPKEGIVKNKRAKLERKQSVMQYMKDQQSIDDDPVANLYTVITDMRTPIRTLIGLTLYHESPDWGLHVCI